jgi:hypothetical protein
MLVILNPSPFVTLSPFASLRINSAKGHPERSEGSQGKLREESKKSMS